MNGCADESCGNVFVHGPSGALAAEQGPDVHQPAPGNVEPGEEGRLTPSGCDLEEDGPVDKGKKMTEAWTTWGLQAQRDDPEELHHKLWLEADA